MGEIVSETGRAVTTEQFSFIKKGLKIIHYEWLGDLILYKIFSLTGYTGLSIFKAFLSVLLFIILFVFSRKISSHITAIVLLMICYALSLEFIVVEKPVFLSMILLSLLIYLLSSNNIKTLYLIPLLFLLWANIHPSFLFGLFYLFFFITGYVLDNIREKKDNYGKMVLYYVLIFTISILLTFITPFGYKLFLKILEQKSIGDLIVKYEITILIILKLYIPFLFGIILLLLTLYNIRYLKLKTLLPFLAISWLPFIYANTIVLFLLFSVPVAVNIINLVFERNSEIFATLSKYKFTNLYAMIPVVFAITIILYKYHNDIAGIYGTGRMNLYYPEGALKFIKEQKLYGKWFNSLEFGGAIAMDGSQEILPFIYTGNNFLDDIFNNYYRKFVKEPQALDDFLRNSDVAGAVFLSGGDTTFLPHFELLKKGAFAPVYWDDTAVVLVNRNMVEQNFLKRYELNLINPFTILQYLNSGGPISEELNEEIKSSVERAKDSSKTHLIYGMLLFKEGKMDAAEKELKESFKLNPDNIMTALTLESLYRRINKGEEAEYYQNRAEYLRKKYKK
jgi:hypothetical protein